MAVGIKRFRRDELSRVSKTKEMILMNALIMVDTLKEVHQDREIVGDRDNLESVHSKMVGRLLKKIVKFGVVALTRLERTCLSFG
jgi:hypothetical protein